jgi:Alpha/beta hydrolase domain
MRRNLLAAVAALLLTPCFVQARITKIVIEKVQSPTFGGKSFGEVGQYEKIVGRAYGEVDPTDPRNALITDINRAPLNSLGHVEYDTPFYILRPVNFKPGRLLLIYDVVNRGNKIALSALDRVGGRTNDPTAAADAGDGFLMRQGAVMVWGGWQGDLRSTADLMAMNVPVATESGSTISGRVRVAYSFGIWMTVGTHTDTQFLPSNESVSADNSGATLTKRVHQADSPIPVPNNAWAFADCAAAAFPGVPNTSKICLKDGFDSNFLYELTYTAKDPKVLGLGFAATRDLVSFFRHAEKDDAGTPNPLAGGFRAAILFGISQSGYFTRQYLHLGFNEDETGKTVFEGMYPDLTTGRLQLNIRFAQGSSAYSSHYGDITPRDAPFTWTSTYDPIAGYSGGVLERCLKTHTCPKIIQSVSATEYWGYRASLDTTDALGTHDLPIPPNVRMYFFSSAPHQGASASSAGMCQQLNNPINNPSNPVLSIRALFLALENWVLDGKEPPASEIPTIRGGTLVRPDQASTGWPTIPGVKYTGLIGQSPIINRGSGFIPGDESGIAAEPPTPTPGARQYVVLVPKVDTDGNDVAGIRSTTILAPVGTYTGWNLRRAGYGEGDMCDLWGSFIPFKRSKAERVAAGDPRLSLEERYGNHAGYVAAVRRGADALVAKGFLLPEDAASLVADAEASDILQ